MIDNFPGFCDWCSQPSVIIWVHGHGQCSVCVINIDECCRGEHGNENLILPSKSEKREHENKND